MIIIGHFLLNICISNHANKEKNPFCKIKSLTLHSEKSIYKQNIEY